MPAAPDPRLQQLRADYAGELRLVRRLSRSDDARELARLLVLERGGRFLREFAELERSIIAGRKSRPPRTTDEEIRKLFAKSVARRGGAWLPRDAMTAAACLRREHRQLDYSAEYLAKRLIQLGLCRQSPPSSLEDADRAVLS